MHDHWKGVWQPVGPFDLPNDAWLVASIICPDAGEALYEDVTYPFLIDEDDETEYLAAWESHINRLLSACDHPWCRAMVRLVGVTDAVNGALEDARFQNETDDDYPTQGGKHRWLASQSNRRFSDMRLLMALCPVTLKVWLRGWNATLQDGIRQLGDWVEPRRGRPKSRTAAGAS